MTRTLLLSLLLGLAGCAATKEAVGEYVTEAVKADLTKRLDAELAKRGLDRAELLTLFDSDGDGKVSAAEINSNTRATVKDVAAVTLEERFLPELQRYAERQANTGTAWGKAAALGVLLVTVLGTAAGRHFLATDKDRAARLAALERVSGIDLNRDGVVGT